MIIGVDHVVVGVRDLGAATRAFERLGFVVERGGRHPGHGSENALVRFAHDYLELMGVWNADEALHGVRGGSTGLVERLAAREGIMAVGLRSDDLDRDVARLREVGGPVEDPVAGRRVRPDEVVLRWRFAFMGGMPWQTPFPFLIQWHAPHPEGPCSDSAPPHHNGAAAVAAIAVAVSVADLGPQADLFEHGLGLERVERHADHARYRLGPADVELFTPRADEEAERHLHQWGQGIFRVALAVPDVSGAAAALTRGGAPAQVAALGARPGVRLPPESSCGANLWLVERGAIRDARPGRCPRSRCR